MQAWKLEVKAQDFVKWCSNRVQSLPRFTEIAQLAQKSYKATIN